MQPKDHLETATLAGGCFWCTEAVFQRLKGVDSVNSGYAGGTMANPSYEDVVYQDTGHAEAIQIKFDPKIISFETLLEIFWATHNPTSKNRQNYDVGPMYRSAIFYHSQDQKKIAEQSKAQHQSEFTEPIVTEIVPFTSFYKAEDYHQNFYNNNKSVSLYCPIVIDPKIKKLLDEFGDLVKDEYRSKSVG